MFDTEKFIHAVKCRPVLYNPSSEGWGKKDVKSAKWQEVGSIMYRDWMNLTGTIKEQKLREMSTKWKSIRDHFVKELRMAKSAQNKKKRKYIYFDELKFLLPTVESKQFSQNTSDSENDTLLAYGTTDSDRQDSIGVSNMSSLLGNAEDDIGRMTYRDDEMKKSNNCDNNIGSYNGHHGDGLPDVGELLEVQHHVDDSRYCNVLSSDEKDRDNSFHDVLGNQAFLMSLLPIMNKLPMESIMAVRIEIMQVLQRHAPLKSEQS